MKGQVKRIMGEFNSEMRFIGEQAGEYDINGLPTVYKFMRLRFHRRLERHGADGEEAMRLVEEECSAASDSARAVARIRSMHGGG